MKKEDLIKNIFSPNTIIVLEEDSEGNTKNIGIYLGTINGKYYMGHLTDKTQKVSIRQCNKSDIDLKIQRPKYRSLDPVQKDYVTFLKNQLQSSKNLNMEDIEEEIISNLTERQIDMIANRKRKLEEEESKKRKSRSKKSKKPKKFDQKMNDLVDMFAKMKIKEFGRSRSFRR